MKPERNQNNRTHYRDNWWIIGEPRKAFRPALVGLNRFIETTETAKHRFLVLLNHEVLPDNMLTNVAAILGTRFSRIHVVWALETGGRLGIGNDPCYNKTRCFETFPFPNFSDKHQKCISAHAEKLDAHRKRQQELHSDLTMTGMYNVLEKLRSGAVLTAKEKQIHEKGLVSVLKQIHDELDAAVFDAYGWPHDLTDEEILERLVALNHERAEEEKRGLIRWLRPEFQNPSGGKPSVQPELELEGDSDDEDDADEQSTKGKGKKKKPAAAKAKTPAKAAWPK